jgi:hypothetical protein
MLRVGNNHRQAMKSFHGSTNSVEHSLLLETNNYLEIT